MGLRPNKLAGMLASIIPQPALPLAAGARFLWYGDSYVERGATTYVPSAPLVGGKSILAAALWGMVGADPRFDVDVFQNGLKPYGTLKLDGAEQGVSGISVTDPTNSARVAYSIARNPQIVAINIGVNDCNVGATLVAIQAAYTGMLVQFFNAGIPVVIITEAAFRQGATPGDWSPTGAAQLELTALNNWLLSLSTRPGIAGIIDLTGINGNQSVGNTLFLPDKLHMTTYGILQCLPIAQTVLNSLVSAAAVINPIDPANLLSFSSLLGTNGSLTNAVVDPGVAVNLQGVASGLRVTGYAADAAVTLCSKSTTFPFSTVTLPVASPGVVNWAGNTVSPGDAVVFYNDGIGGALPTGLTSGRVVYVSPTNFVAGVSFQVVNTKGSTGGINFTGSSTGTQTGHTGYDAQVVKITPVNDAVKLHSFQFIDSIAITYASLGLAAGDWVRVKIQLTLDNWAGWVPDTDNDGFHQPGQIRIVQSNVSSQQLWIEDDWCGQPNATTVLECVFQLLASGSDEFQALFGLTVYYRSDLGGTGTASISVIDLEKATPPPQNAWGLTGAGP